MEGFYDTSKTTELQAMKYLIVTKLPDQSLNLPPVSPETAYKRNPNAFMTLYEAMQAVIRRNKQQENGQLEMFGEVQ